MQLLDYNNNNACMTGNISNICRSLPMQGHFIHTVHVISIIRTNMQSYNMENQQEYYILRNIPSIDCNVYYYNFQRY